MSQTREENSFQSFFALSLRLQFFFLLFIIVFRLVRSKISFSDFESFPPVGKSTVFFFCEIRFRQFAKVTPRVDTFDFPHKLPRECLIFFPDCEYSIFRTFSDKLSRPPGYPEYCICIRVAEAWVGFH